MHSCIRQSASASTSSQVLMSSWLSDLPSSALVASGRLSVPSAWPRAHIQRSMAFICMCHAGQLSLPFKPLPSGNGLMLIMVNSEGMVTAIG
jgi:hypothetical protein